MASLASIGSFGGGPSIVALAQAQSDAKVLQLAHTGAGASAASARQSGLSQTGASPSDAVILAAMGTNPQAEMARQRGDHAGFMAAHIDAGRRGVVSTSRSDASRSSAFDMNSISTTNAANVMHPAFTTGAINAVATTLGNSTFTKF
jgi:hypothetical protein